LCLEEEAGGVGFKLCFAVLTPLKLDVFLIWAVYFLSAREFFDTIFVPGGREKNNPNIFLNDDFDNKKEKHEKTKLRKEQKEKCTRKPERKKRKQGQGKEKRSSPHTRSFEKVITRKAK
jgi:hypothetical protein